MIKKIEISADIKKVKESLRELDKLLDKSTDKPRKTSLFEKQEMDSLKNWAKQQVPQVQKEILRIKKEMKGISDIDLLVNTKRKVTDLEKQLKRLQKIELGQVSTALTRQAAGGGVGGLLGRIPGVGGALSRFGMGGLALGGLGLGAAGLGISRGISGYQQRRGEAPSRLALMGAAGVEQYGGFLQRGGPYAGGALGYDVNETLAQANQLIRSVGRLTTLPQIQRTARGFGLDPNQLIGMQGGLRRAGGAGNVERNFATLVGSAVSSGLERGLVGDYLQTTANFIEQIATEGTADVRQMAGAVSGLVRQGGLMQNTERATKALGSLDSMIKNAQGARFGFFATALEGKTGTETLLRMNQGLFGPDLDIDPTTGKSRRLTALSSKQAMALRGPGFAERSQAITRQFDRLTQGMDVAGKALVSSKLTGIKDAGEAFNFVNALKQGKFSEKELRKKYETAMMTPEQKMLDVMKNTFDMKISTLDAHNVENLSKLGEAVAPSVQSIRETLMGLESDVFVPMVQGVARLVDKFVGTGSSLGMSEEAKARTRTDLYAKAVASGSLFDVPLKGATGRLKTGNLREGDIGIIKKELKTANEAQRMTIERDAQAKLVSSQLELARGKKAGEIDPEREQQLLTNIRLSKQLTKGPVAGRYQKQLLRAVESDPSLLPYLSQQTDGTVPVNTGMNLSGMNNQLSQSTPVLTEDSAKMLQNSLDRHTAALEANNIALNSNTRITEDNTKSVNIPTQGIPININKYRNMNGMGTRRN